MWWALIKKELRDIWQIGLVALALHLILVSGVTGAGWLAQIQRMFGVDIVPGRTATVPFFGQYMDAFTIICIGFLALLAFRQIAWEEAKGTYLFLLHRPLRRRAIFLSKIVAGLGLYLTVSLFSVVAYGMWAATPGNHPSPFEWSMTEDVLRILFTLPVIYLGLFIVGVRPGRWFGTRLLPLATCGGLAMILPMLPAERTWCVVATLAVMPVLILHIGYWAENRDFG